ncbi:hypothetical protein Tco_0596259 [Tanacetum coccineum]
MDVHGEELVIRDGSWSYDVVDSETVNDDSQTSAIVAERGNHFYAASSILSPKIDVKTIMSFFAPIGNCVRKWASSEFEKDNVEVNHEVFKNNNENSLWDGSLIMRRGERKLPSLEWFPDLDASWFYIAGTDKAEFPQVPRDGFQFSLHKWD